MSTTVKIYDTNGKLHEFEVASAEAILRLLSNPCVRKLRDREPFFLLRGQDATAADYVQEWAYENRSTLDGSKFLDALQVSQSMRDWPIRKDPT